METPPNKLVDSGFGRVERAAKGSKKSRMFCLGDDRPIKTWNPVVGCKHHCYGDRCWAARMARRLRNLPQYKDGFNCPKLVEKELGRKFRAGDVVFVSSMGDLFGDWVPAEWIRRVLAVVAANPQTTFLLETKHPKRYFEFLPMPNNVILSTTIETNRDYGQSKAPPPRERYVAMLGLPDNRKKHVSIEPIMDFDMEELVGWMENLNPVSVSVGYDNYNCRLPEPPLEKTLALIKELERFTKVERKNVRQDGPPKNRLQSQGVK